MKPFTDLPIRVLASLAGILALAVLAGLLWPRMAVLAAVLAVLVTVAGGLAVAIEARFRRMGLEPDTAASRRTTAAIGVAVGAGGLAIALAAPGLYVKDAGELASSALVLGVPHPTGFPAFCMAGRAFGFLPFGDAFFRMNLLSAVSLGVAGMAAWLLAQELAAGAGDRAGAGGKDPAGTTARFAALAAPATLLASPTTWLHGTTTEVYALSAAGMTASIACALAGMRRRDARWLAAGAFLAGLGAGGHVTWPVMAGWVLAISTIVRVVQRPAAWPLLPVAAVASLAGGLAVLYLPVAAARDPVMNWGDPSGLGGVLDHLTGARIRRSFEGRIGTVSMAMWGANLRLAVGTLAEGTLAMWPLAAVGLAGLAVRDPVTSVALAGVLLGDLAFATRVNPMGIRDLQVLVPTTVMLGVLAGVGIEVLARLARHRGHARWGPLVVAAGLAAPDRKSVV